MSEKEQVSISGNETLTSSHRPRQSKDREYKTENTTRKDNPNALRIAHFEAGEGVKVFYKPFYGQNFYNIRDECLEQRKLWEDPKFEANDSSLYFSQAPPKTIEWKRPWEICSHARFIVDGVNRFDVRQGELGDCWFLAAVAQLTLQPNLFFRIVPKDQGFVEKYAGIFHFRFWRFGRWVEVVVDDRLPTSEGRLVFLHSNQHSEFWGALLEKAYAKLCSSYEALKGGNVYEAMEDFTGGVGEQYDLQNPSDNLFLILLKAHQRSSFIGCSIESNPNVIEERTREGLVKGHAYSITRVQYVNFNQQKQTRIPLLRLLNPWGNEIEWNGAWSDKSPEWRSIPDSEKQKMGLVFENDGEFWMCFQDFVKHFMRLEICNLSPDSLIEEQLSQSEKRWWEVSMFDGAWVKGVSAGGCRNYLDTFSLNPQYRITLDDIDEDDDEGKCTVIVALMQKYRRRQKYLGRDFLTIGFALFRLKNVSKLPKPLDTNFFTYNASVARSPTFIDMREVSARFFLPRGTYCIIPSTFEPNEEGEFLLRVFSEKKNHIQENDDEVDLRNVDREEEKRIPSAGELRLEKKVEDYFYSLAGQDMEIDWMDLKEILDYGFIKGTSQKRFSKDICRSMIAMLDEDCCGKMGFEEFKTLWTDIRLWKLIYKKYRNEEHGYLTTFELREALNAAGYRLNNHILNVLAHRYAGKDSRISFDDFIMCAVKLKTMIGIFKSYDKSNINRAEFSLQEWLVRTVGN